MLPEGNVIIRKLTFQVTVSVPETATDGEALSGVQAALENASGIMNDPLSVWELESVRFAD
jgi:hypothetical protein